MNEPVLTMMVTCASVARPTGYAMRTRLALAALRRVIGWESSSRATAGLSVHAHDLKPTEGQSAAGPRSQPVSSEETETGGCMTPVDATRAMPIRLVCFESLRDVMRGGLRTRIAENLDFPAEAITIVATWPKKLPGAWRLNQRRTIAALRRLIARYRPAIVHAQSHLAAGFSARALRDDHQPELVFDVHGIDIEEALADGRLRAGSAEHRARVALQREALARAQWLLPVSRPLADHLLGDAYAEPKVVVLPCVGSLQANPAAQAGSHNPGAHSRSMTSDTSSHLDSLAIATRRRLGLDDRPLVGYLGSAAPWQQPQLLVRCFAALRHRANSVAFLVISPERKTFERLLQEAGIAQSDYRCVSLPHEHTLATLAACDVGFLLRDDTLVNRVASPTKFGEYLRAGVPVVVSRSLADFATVTESHRLGVVVPSDAEPEPIATAAMLLLRSAPEERRRLRNSCVEIGHTQFGFEAAVGAFRQIYGRRGVALGFSGPGRPAPQQHAAVDPTTAHIQPPMEASHG